MTIITPMLALPTSIQAGLASSTYMRFGGTIRETATGRIVALLRDTGPSISSQTLALLQIGSAASVLNLGITTIGFAVVLKRLDELERRLQSAQKLLHHIDTKLDITFYGNVRAALDLATNALTMTNLKHRESSAMHAIAMLAKARYHYTALADLHLDQQSQFVDEYIATLTLAYVAEARCYLELEEADAAQRIIERGTSEVGTRARQHVQTLLTSNPAAYLHPKLRGTIDLRRLTPVIRWLDPTLDENGVFDAQRENLFAIARKPEEWIQRLPRAIWDPKVDQLDQGVALPGLGRVNLKDWGVGWLGSGESTEDRVLQRLPAAMLTMEALIEDARRLASYQTEVQVIRQLGVSFQDWQRLLPNSSVPDNESELTYLVLSEPLMITGNNT
jgi:hypothetical protein